MIPYNTAMKATRFPGILLDPSYASDSEIKSSMNDSNQRLARLEKKVDWILRLVGIQIVLFLGMALWYGLTYVFQLASTITLVILVAVPLLYVFRKRLPAPILGAIKQGGVLTMALARAAGRKLRTEDQM